MNKVYELLVGEPWDFEAHDGANRLLVEEVGIALGPQRPNWGDQYLLLRVVKPFEWENQRVEFLVAAPRHEGTTLDSLRTEGTNAGIARVKQGLRLEPNQRFAVDDVDYFLVGLLQAVGRQNNK